MPAGEARHIKCLSRLGREAKMIVIIGFVNDPVESARRGALGGLGRSIVRLRFQHVGQIVHSNRDSRRADAPGILGVQSEAIGSRGRQLDLLAEFPGRIAEKAKCKLLAGLPAVLRKTEQSPRYQLILTTNYDDTLELGTRNIKVALPR